MHCNVGRIYNIVVPFFCCYTFFFLFYNLNFTAWFKPSKQVRTSELIEVVDTEFFNPSALIFLYRKNLFMCFQGTKLEVWSFHGELFTSFEDNTLQHGIVNSNNIYITDDQEIIISYCKVGEESYNEEEGNYFTYSILLKYILLSFFFRVSKTVSLFRNHSHLRVV